MKRDYATWLRGRLHMLGEAKAYLEEHLQDDGDGTLQQRLASVA